MPRDIHLARQILEHLGVTLSALDEIRGLGEVNHVFHAKTSDGEWVLRFGRDENGFDNFDKEAWCLRRFAVSEIPVPELVSYGEFKAVPYIVYRYVEGQNADHIRSTELWQTLGLYARIVNEIEIDAEAPDSLFSRFGRDLPKSWHAHLNYNLDELTSNDPLIKLGVYELSQQDQIKALIDRLGDKVNQFGLTHGDIVPKNVILPPSGPPILIDWGSASAGPIPHPDLMRIWASPDPETYTPQELSQFTEGYGVDFEDFHQTLTGIQLLNNLDIVRWAIDRRPDLLESKAESSRAFIQTNLL